MKDLILKFIYNFGKIYGAAFLACGVYYSFMEYTPAGEYAIDLIAALTLIAPFVIGYRIYKWVRNEKYTPAVKPAPKRVSTNAAEEETLPTTNEGRKKIVADFNREFELNLTDGEIDKIVSGSFLSPEWADEIRAMKKKYTSKDIWYMGNTAWLRAYIRAFSIQNISSDFNVQKEICIDNFNEIFEAVSADGFSSIDQMIDYINRKYLTNFNDISFMIAYRFLRENGKKYKLPDTTVTDMSSPADDLEKKYMSK